MASEEPIKPSPPGRVKKFFLKAFKIPRDRLDSLQVEDFVKVADVKAAGLAEVIVRMQDQNWRRTDYRVANRRTGIDLMNALGTDHVSMTCGDVIKTPTSEYMEFTPDGFRQVNLAVLPSRETRRRQGFTYLVEYLIHLGNSDDLIMEAYFKTKKELTKEDISTYINQKRKDDNTRGKYLVETYMDDPIPTILPLPYRITRLKKEQGF